MEGFCSFLHITYRDWGYYYIIIFLLRVCSLWKGQSVYQLKGYSSSSTLYVGFIICGRQILFRVDKFFPGFINSFRVHFGTHFKIHWGRAGYSSLFFYSPFQCAPVDNEIEGAQVERTQRRRRTYNLSTPGLSLHKDISRLKASFSIPRPLYIFNRRI